MHDCITANAQWTSHLSPLMQVYRQNHACCTIIRIHKINLMTSRAVGRNYAQSTAIQPVTGVVHHIKELVMGYLKTFPVY